MSMTTTQHSFCTDCDEVQPYQGETGTGIWFCKSCGFAIACVECGRSMSQDHDCATIEEALR